MHPLRPFQREALEALREEIHLICVAPTGSGKSLIYETLAARPGSRMLLVTPLVALGRQQHERLRSRGVDVRLGAGTPKEPPPAGNEPGAWIVSPEILHFENRRRELREWKPNFLVIDECHCLWDWGDRFRPSFAAIPELLKEYPIRRSLWLTATLPVLARAQLKAQLTGKISELGDFSLPGNLRVEVARVPWSFRAETLVKWLSGRKEPGIIFVPTRATTDRVSRLLSAVGRKVLSYHAGMGSEERCAIEHAIKQNDCDVIVATSAFGMGMDHPQLRWVVLWQAPHSLLSLTQSIGRAGRDPEIEAHALILWDEDDFRLIEWMLQGSERRKKELEATHAFLRNARCREQSLSQYFSTNVQQNRCNRCDFCATS